MRSIPSMSRDISPPVPPGSEKNMSRSEDEAGFEESFDLAVLNCLLRSETEASDYRSGCQFGVNIQERTQTRWSVASPSRLCIKSLDPKVPGEE
jgi:hypothetical protein